MAPARTTMTDWVQQRQEQRQQAVQALAAGGVPVSRVWETARGIVVEHRVRQGGPESITACTEWPRQVLSVLHAGWEPEDLQIQWPPVPRTEGERPGSITLAFALRSCAVRPGRAPDAR